MMNNTQWVTVNSGEVSVAIYSNPNEPYLRSCISDLYANLVNFGEIHWIMNIRPNNGFSTLDTLKDLTKLYDDRNVLLFAQAGTICPMAAYGSVAEGKEMIKNQQGILYNANFDHVLFNRCMDRTYANDCIFIYHNKAESEWIKNNTGDNKIVKCSNSKSEYIESQV